jgi:hypothetical protein
VFTYLFSNMFRTSTQAIKCLIPFYILAGIALPFFANLIMTSIFDFDSQYSEIYFELFLGALFCTSPLFTFYISMYSLIMAHMAVEDRIR